MCYSGNIVYPWRSTTAIVKSGNDFEVWFNSDVDQDVTGLELQGPYNKVECNYSITRGDWEYDPLSGNRYNMKIKVTVPFGTPADRYNLVLQTSSGLITSYGGVKVVTDFKDNYYIMHMSDGHLYQNGYDPVTLFARKSAMIEMANIMDCQIIIETGDNMYNVRNHPEREEQYFLGIPDEGIKGMAQANAATFLIPGDHDAYTANDWPQASVQLNSDFFNDYWGLQNSNFAYGNGRFMLLNNAWGVSTESGNEHQYQCNDAVAWLNGEGSGGNFFLSAGHCYNKMHEFIDASQPLSLVLSGDKHHIRTDNPYPFNDGSDAVAYIAGSIRDHFEFNLFRVNNTTGTYSTVAGINGVVEVLSAGNQDDRSTWEPNLILTYDYANDGTSYENTATIDNKFNFPVSEAKVRFIMPLGTQYVVTNGDIEQSFNGISVHVVDVRVNVGANSSETIKIIPSDVEDLCPEDPTKIAPGECGCGVPESVCNTINVEALNVSEEKITLNVHLSHQLTCTITPSNATNQNVLWSSSNTSVATVSSNGLVTAVGGGVAKIIATAEDGGITSASEITVIPDFLTLQAEDAAHGGVAIKSDQEGYNGIGFVDFVNASDDFITWTVNVASSSSYSLGFRYALLSGSRALQLKINGEVRVEVIDFPVTGSWSNWQYYRINQSLKAGTNTITLAAIGFSGGNYDELSIGASEIDTGIGGSDFKQVGKSICIYPNPYKQGKLKVAFNGFEEYGNVELKIINIMGAIVYKGLLNISSAPAELNLTGKLMDSLYFVSVETDEFRIVEKMVVNH